MEEGRKIHESQVSGSQETVEWGNPGWERNDIVEREAEDPEGKKSRQVILQRADLKESTGASVTGAKVTRFSGHMRLYCRMGSAAWRRGGAGVGTLGILRGCTGPVGISLSGRRDSRERKGVPVFPPWPLSHSTCCLAYGRQVPSRYLVYNIHCTSFPHTKERRWAWLGNFLNIYKANFKE